jgi:hypothetical protein
LEVDAPDVRFVELIQRRPCQCANHSRRAVRAKSSDGETNNRPAEIKLPHSTKTDHGLSLGWDEEWTKAPADCWQVFLPYWVYAGHCRLFTCPKSSCDAASFSTNHVDTSPPLHPLTTNHHVPLVTASTRRIPSPQGKTTRTSAPNSASLTKIASRHRLETITRPRTRSRYTVPQLLRSGHSIFCLRDFRTAYLCSLY